ncbi:MAG: M3 family metallopeptidase, partial [Bdellovibrionales bacterium]
MILRSLFLAMLSSSLTFAGPDGFVDPDFERETERAKVLAALDQLPIPGIQINGLDAVSAQKIELLTFLNDVWIPYANEIHRNNISWYILVVALHRVLYRDLSEKEEWKARSIRHLDKKNSIMQSEEFRRATERLYLLSRGLSGDLVKLIERYWQSMSQFEVDAGAESLTMALSQLRSDISDVHDSSPIGAKLAEHNAAILDLKKRYYAGEISLEEAAARWVELLPISIFAKGEDVGKRGEALFNRQAVLLTQLAKSLGYRTHADYIFKKKAEFYSPSLRTIDRRVRLLRALLEQTREPAEMALKHLLKPSGAAVRFEDLTMAELAFLPPETDSLVSEYFPKENVNSFWRNFFIESGFSITQLNNLTLDSYPREGKFTHAYMAPQSLHKPRVFEVDANSLKVVTPPYDPAFWFPSLISIVQNVRADLANYYRTVGHEMGHFLEFDSLSFTDGPFMLIDHEGDPVRSTMWSETPSMAMEMVLEDVELLANRARSRTGELMPRALAEEYVQNVGLTELLSMRSLMAGSLLDYTLWNYDFENGSETFVQRLRRLDREIKKKYFFGVPIANCPVDLSYSRFNTSHWTNGDVKYEYVFANMSAVQVNERILDILEQTTGRRTYLMQPGLARILVDQLYRHSFGEAYPANVERFTDKP